MPVIALGLGSLVVAAAGYLLGCGSGSKEEPLEPDLPKPVDGGGWKPDSGRPDLSSLDQSTPDWGVPDWSVPDWSVPDLSVPDSDDSGPFVKDTPGKDVADAIDVADVSDTGCAPDPCSSTVIVKDWKSLLEGTCVKFAEKHVAAGLTATGVWSGISVADYNKDGKPDIYLLGDGTTSNVLYRNDGGTFTDVSVATKLNITAKSRFAAWGDFDGDGDLDLALVTKGGTDLYENKGGVFEIMPVAKGIHDTELGKTAVWLGVNLLLGTTNGTRYYKSLGGGSFKEDAIGAGLDDIGEASAFAVRTDGAGRLHLYDANLTGKNRYFRETSKGSGTYDSIAETTGTIGSGNSAAAAWTFIQEEPTPSLFVANYLGGNHLFMDKAGKYVDDAKVLGIADPGNTVHAVWADVVGNRRPFLFLGRWEMQNLFYGPEIDGTGSVTKYIDHAFPLGMATKGKTVGAGAFDYDGDGRPDLVVVMVDGLALHHNVSTKVKLCAGGG